MRSFGLISHLFLGERHLAARTGRSPFAFEDLVAAFNARYSPDAGVDLNIIAPPTVSIGDRGPRPLPSEKMRSVLLLGPARSTGFFPWSSWRCLSCYGFCSCASCNGLRDAFQMHGQRKRLSESQSSWPSSRCEGGVHERGFGSLVILNQGDRHGQRSTKRQSGDEKAQEGQGQGHCGSA